MQPLQQLPAVGWDLSIPKGVLQSPPGCQEGTRDADIQGLCEQGSGEEWAGEVAAIGGRKCAGWFEAQVDSWTVLGQGFNAQGSCSVQGSFSPWHEGSPANLPFLRNTSGMVKT